ncbi:MAG: glycoside hydrolase family 30 beta sandwich domain-containing protein, partial [Tannerellaceae bacterium]
SWQGAEYSWNLMRFYLENGANAYMYWNMALEKGGVSRWGWAQNSLVVVDPQTKAYNYTYEYYVMKHASHFVKPGASVVTTQGTYKDAIAFVNLDGSMVLLVANTTDNAATINTAVDKTLYRLSLAPHSINTFLIKKEV